MRSGRDSWSVASGPHRVEVELDPGPVGASEREESARLLRGLVWDARRGQREAMLAVQTMHARLRGHSSLIGGAPFRAELESVAETLLAAARAGRLLARTRALRIQVAATEAEEEVLGPTSSPPSSQQTKSWVGLVLVDQEGAPVAGRPYRLTRPDGTTIDGTLDSNGTAMMSGLDPGNCQIWCPYVEPRPETTYVVQPGDHVSGIAQAFGFDDYTVVWSDPGNADLQSQRSDPHVLLPGDSLVVPEVKAQPPANKPTGNKHTFTIQRSPLKLRVALLGRAAKPVTGAQVTLAGGALTTDGQGLVEAPVDKGARTVSLALPGGEQVDLNVGGLNPSDDASVSGYKARLYNLGFLWDPTVDDSDDEMVIALQDFQAEYALTVSGQLDDATKSQLVQAYGC